MRRFAVGLVVAAFGAAGLPTSALAQGMGGDPHDRLDWPGSPTDRYLTSDEVRDRLHEATEGFFGCFRESLRSKPEGAAAVEFTIDGEGKAGSILVDRGKAPESLEPCIQRVVAGIEFGGHDGDPLEVSYPLVYEVDTGGARVLPYPIVFTRPRPIRLPLLGLPLDVSAGELRMLELILTKDAPAGPAEAPAEDAPAAEGGAESGDETPEAPAAEPDGSDAR